MKKTSFEPFITCLNYLSRQQLKVLKTSWVSLVSLFYAFTLSIHVTLPVYLQWPFAFAILFIFPGLVLNRFLRSVFRFKVGDAPSMGVVAALSVITFSITLLILNYSPLTFCTATFVQLLSIVIIGLDFISFSLSERLLKPQNSLNNDQNRFDSAFSSGEITERKKLAMFIRNLLMIAIVIAFYLSQEFLLIIFGLPMRLSTILGTSVISLLFVLVIGIPLTSMFWYFIADPSLNSCKRLSLHVFRKSNHLTLKSKLISSVAVALVAALIAAIPMVLQFLPPGFDTGKYLLELDGLFMNHFNFPFALEGRMRAVRPITYLNLAAIRLAFGVDALMAQRIYVVVWYAIVTVGMYGLIVRYKENSVAVTAAILWAMALPSLSLIMGINAQLAGSIFIFPIIELLFQATKSKVAYIIFVLLGIFLILADDLLSIFYLEFIVALSALLILNSVLNGTFRQRIKETLSFFVLGITPFIIMTPYLFKYLQVYTTRILSLELQTVTAQNASEYFLETFNMLVSPWGWFGPVICLIIILGAYHLVKGKHQGVGPLTLIAVIWMTLALAHWFSPVLYPVASSTPIRFLELATFTTSFLLAKLLLEKSSSAGLKRANSLIVKPSFCNFKIRIIGHSRFIRFIAVGLIIVPMTCSSLQYALGEYPNIFSTYQHPAAISYPERETYYKAILWMRDNLPSGVVLTDFATGNWWPALLGDFTVGILDPVAYGTGVVTLWHKQPYWDKHIVMKSFDGYLTSRYLKELCVHLKELGLDDVPIYLLITPFFNANFPKMTSEDFDKLSSLKRIYVSNDSRLTHVVKVYQVSSQILSSEQVKVQSDGATSYQQLEYDFALATLYLNLTGSSSYNITEIPITLSYKSINPEPLRLEVDANTFVAFNGTPEVTYKVTFEEIPSPGNIIWKDDSFKALKPTTGEYPSGVEWTFWESFASTNGSMLNITVTKKEIAGVQRELGADVSEARCFIIRYRVLSTTGALFSLELIDSNRAQLLLQYLPPKKEFTTMYIPLNETIASRLFYTRLLIESNVQLTQTYFIDYVALSD